MILRQSTDISLFAADEDEDDNISLEDIAV